MSGHVPCLTSTTTQTRDIVADRMFFRIEDEIHGFAFEQRGQRSAID